VPHHEDMSGLFDDNRAGPLNLRSPDCHVSPVEPRDEPSQRPRVPKCKTMPLIHGPSSPMENVLHLVRSVARTNATVLLTGESGTGKEIVASLVHRFSPREQAGFVPVNCGAIPDQLLESELFGHLKGAFTGASQRRVGRFTIADEGTIFLDEIGEIPQRLQVKLLRVLQERSYEPVGSSMPHKSDFRVVAATNQDLEKLIEEGRFRADLYYRLNVFPVHIPPLRDRRMDVPPLVDHFVRTANADFATEVTGTAPEVVAALCANDWPGNVRELQNAVQRMVILRREGEIQPADLPEKLKGGFATVAPTTSSAGIPEEGVNLPCAVEEYERALIVQALQKTSGNKSRAANLLGLNRTTLVEKIKRKEIGAAN